MVEIHVVTELKPPVITLYDEITYIVNDKRPTYEIGRNRGFRLSSRSSCPRYGYGRRWLCLLDGCSVSVTS